MNKQEFLEKIDYFIGVENNAENEFMPIHLDLIKNSALPREIKDRCIEIINQLSEDSHEHARILEELKKNTVGGENHDF